eukprot:3168127-Alexandrium_andersonii.AAC.1
MYYKNSNSTAVRVRNGGQLMSIGGRRCGLDRPQLEEIAARAIQKLQQGQARGSVAAWAKKAVAKAQA